MNNTKEEIQTTIENIRHDIIYFDYDDAETCEASYELGGMIYEGVDVCKFPPTHWMPLPPSPSDKGVE